MKYLFNWLKELSGTRLFSEKVAELLTMMKYKIDDIRHFNGGDLMFIKQF